MAWHPKYVGGRIEFSNGEGATITVFSTIDSESITINLTKLGIRLYNARWNSDGLIVQAEDGKTILIRCNRERYQSTEEMMSQWAGHDIISPEEGNRIRKEAELQKSIDAKYDKVIVWCCYDEDLKYNDEILQSLVISQKQRIKETWNQANKGDADAQNEVARYYQNGIGVAKDNAEAVRWYKKAADKGNANAQDNLGWMYQNGFGVNQNYSEAVSWYEKAASQGHANAQNNLGWMIHNGWGIEQNDDEAIKWFKKSADQGNTYALNNLKMMKSN